MEIALTKAAPQPMARVDPEAALIRGMAAGEEAALRSLFAAHSRRLFAYAIHLTGSSALAEEVLQDSLLAAWQGARSFRGKARGITWLLGIVHHQALNATRRKRLPMEDLGQAAEVADGEPGPAAQAEAAERRRALQIALAGLSPQHRAVLELVFCQGLSLAEAAEVCRCPLGTIKSRLSYAKAHLRRALAAAGVRKEDLP